MSISLNYYSFEPKINSRSFYLDWYNDNKKNILCQFTMAIQFYLKRIIWTGMNKNWGLSPSFFWQKLG